MARQTLVDYVENERAMIRVRAAAASTLTPKMPGQQVAPKPGSAGTVKPQPPVPPAMPTAQPGAMNTLGPQTQPVGPATPPKNPKPAAKNAAEHVANHIQDPLGSTQETFQQLGQKQLEYEQQKENARRTLAPVKAVLQHVTQLHQLEPEDEAMGYQDPNNPQPQQPNFAQPSAPGAAPKGNMASPTDQMNRNRPSQTGFAPGKTAGPAQSVRPAKLGQPAPGGKGGDPSSPSKKTASGSKAKSGGGDHSIKLHIQGSQRLHDRGIKTNTPSLESAMDYASLNSVKAEGPGSGCRGPNCGRVGKKKFKPTVATIKNKKIVGKTRRSY